MLDKLILDYRDKEIFNPKDFQPTTIKTKLGEIPIARRRYKMVINGDGAEWTGRIVRRSKRDISIRYGTYSKENIYGSK